MEKGKKNRRSPVSRKKARKTRLTAGTHKTVRHEGSLEFASTNAQAKVRPQGHPPNVHAAITIAPERIHAKFIRSLIQLEAE